MTVWQIVNQFTSLDFNLVVIDVGYYGELYRGPANDVIDDPVASYSVIAMEPPRCAREVILHVDVDEYLDIDSYELFSEET